MNAQSNDPSVPSGGLAAAQVTGDAAAVAAADAMKLAFREHPAGVAIITAQTPEGPVGLTASSVASVAVDPPALSFSVTKATGSAGGVLDAPTFVVHLLDSRHAGLAQTFAVSGTERFTEAQGWSTLETGEPVLRGSRIALRCRALQITEVGSSAVVVAEVLDAYFEDTDEVHEPMVYLNRQFRQLGEQI